MAAASSSSLLSVRKFLERVWTQISADDLTGLAAEMSFYFVLSIFPFLIFLAAVVGSLPFTEVWSAVLNWILLYFPRESQPMVFQIVLGLTAHRESFLSIGLLGSTWAASIGLMSLTGAFNRVYKVQETRGFVKRLALAVLLVVILALLLVCTFGILSFGDWLGHQLTARSLRLVAAVLLWRVTRWIASVILIGVGITLLEHTLPNLRRRWRDVVPGDAFMLCGWLLASAGFNFYAQHFATFDQTYGVLAVFVILMIWIYFVSLVTLAGAEINAALIQTRGRTGDGR